MSFKVDRWPADGPTVVLLHAGVCDRRSWHATAEHLDDLNLIAYDRRGFGETPPTDDDFSHLADLMTVLDEETATGEPVWLVGNSMGAALALDAALTHRDRIAGLVLIGPAVSGRSEPAETEYDPNTRQIAAAMEQAEDDDDLEELNRLEIHLWLDGPAGPEGRVDGPARDLALDMNRIALKSGMPEDAGESGVDAWSRLAEITQPVTVAYGDLDIPIANDATRELAARLPNVRDLHVFEGVAHLPGLERPHEVAELIDHTVRT